MEKFFPILKQCPLFAHIAESDLSAMLHCLQVTVQHYDRGQIVIHEGEKAERFGIVLTGAVQLWRIDYSGNRSIMANVEPAQIFGESFVCAEVESIPIQAVASASCDVMLIDGSRILHAWLRISSAGDFSSAANHCPQKSGVSPETGDHLQTYHTGKAADLSQSASPAAPVQHVYHSV